MLFQVYICMTYYYHTDIHYEVADLSRNHDKNYTRHADNMPGDEKPHGAGWLV
jgi:hypothetical protein